MVVRGSVDKRPTVDAQSYLNLSDSVLSPLSIFKHCGFFYSFFLWLNDRVRLRWWGKFESCCNLQTKFCPFFSLCSVIFLLILGCRVGEDLLTAIFFLSAAFAFFFLSSFPICCMFTLMLLVGAHILKTHGQMPIKYWGETLAGSSKQPFTPHMLHFYFYFYIYQVIPNNGSLPPIIPFILLPSIFISKRTHC